MTASSAYLLTFIAIILLSYSAETAVDILRIRLSGKPVPKELVGHFDDKQHSAYTRYRKRKSLFSIIQNTFFTALILIFLSTGFFNIADSFARSFGLNEIFTGIVFFSLLFFASSALKIPFSYYFTFNIENEFGFNRTSRRTFYIDIFKSFILYSLIGVPLFFLILWFFYSFGSYAWLLAWGAVSVFFVIFSEISPVLIFPLFNKFSPLEDGELKKKIHHYAEKENFRIKGVYQMDGSKRTSKPNAFFTGFGKTKRIVLYDTLMEKLSSDEITGIVAHEMGHYKKKHILKNIILMILQSGFIFFLLSFFISNQDIVKALKIEIFSLYAGMAAFAFLFTPISFLLSIGVNFFSRKTEHEADRFAVKSTGLKKEFAEALKKIYVTSFGDMNPHSFDVLLNYSHPPVIKRLKALDKI